QTVLTAPTLSQSFSPTGIARTGTSTLTLTISNPAANTPALTGVAVSDTFPAGMQVASTPNRTNTCGGTWSGGGGATTVSLTGGSIPVNSSCTVTVDVTATTAGVQNNTTGNVSSTNGGTGGTASAALTVVAPPTIAKAFSPTTIQLNGASTLTLTLTNPAANTVAESGVAVSDSFPTGVQVASTPNSVNNCGGTLTGATAGSSSISLSAVTLAVSSSCTVSVDVTGTSAGSKNNTTGTVSSTNGGNGTTASATLSVVAP